MPGRPRDPEEGVREHTLTTIIDILDTALQVCRLRHIAATFSCARKCANCPYPTGKRIPSPHHVQDETCRNEDDFFGGCGDFQGRSYVIFAADLQ
jgi:hypothetical protein